MLLFYRLEAGQTLTDKARLQRAPAHQLARFSRHTCYIVYSSFAEGIFSDEFFSCRSLSGSEKFHKAFATLMMRIFPRANWAGSSHQVAGAFLVLI
jgi:hypothetical protein